MPATNIENIVIDQANDRTYVILANRVLTDGELYRVIRQEILRRGSPLAEGETLTMTVTPTGGRITSVAEPEPPRAPLCLAASNSNQEEHFTSPPASLMSFPPEQK